MKQLGGSSSSRLVITFLPRSKSLLISWLQSPSAVILEPKKESLSVSIASPSICHEVTGPDARTLVLWEDKIDKPLERLIKKESEKAQINQNKGSWETTKGKSVQFSSVTQSWPTLYNLMKCSTPGFPVYYQLLELTQTHVHQVSDAIRPSHPQSSPFPPAFNLSQHQGLFKWISSSHQVAKVLELQLQHQPFQCIFRTDFL